MNKFKVGALGFLIFGIIFTFFSGLLIYNNLKIVIEGEIVEAKVVNYEVGGDSFYADLEIDEKDNYRFIHKIGSREQPYEIGETVEVYYYPPNPYKSLIGNFSNIWLLPLIFTIISLSMLGLGYGFWRNTFYFDLKRKRLKDSNRGIRKEAVITDIEHKKSYPVDLGRAVPFIVKAKLPNSTLDNREFRSQYFSQRPDYKVGDKVDVYINPNNDRNYYLDV